MRELTSLEIQSVSGGRLVPAPRPRFDLRALVLAILRRLFDPRRPEPPAEPGFCPQKRSPGLMERPGLQRIGILNRRPRCSP